jgi:hypothetical protein
MINMTLCLTCNGQGKIYAGKLHGKPTYRTCPGCHGIGEHEKEITRKPKEDRGRTGAELQAYCPKCAKPVVTNQYFKATKYTSFTCSCGCNWRMLIEDAKQKIV